MDARAQRFRMADLAATCVNVIGFMVAILGVSVSLYAVTSLGGRPASLVEGGQNALLLYTLLTGVGIVVAGCLLFLAGSLIQILMAVERNTRLLSMEGR